MNDNIFEQSKIIANSTLDDIAAQFKEVKRFSTNSTLDDIAAQFKEVKRFSINSTIDSFLAQFKEVTRFPTLLDQYNSQIELPLKNLQKLFQSKLFPYGISGGQIAQIESQLKNSCKYQYSSYSPGATRNYNRSRGTSSTRNNDYQSQEQNSSQATSKSQNKKQNSFPVTNKSQRNTRPKNTRISLRRDAKLQFKILEEIHLRVISNNNNPVEWGPSEWLGSGEGRRITDIQQSSCHNALTKLIDKGLVKQEKPDRQFSNNTGNAPTLVSLTAEGYLELERLKKIF